MSKSVISPYQFTGRKEVKKDPHPEGSKPSFSGASGSKTMTIAGGRLPKPMAKHPHRRKAGKRSKRAR